MADKKKKPTQAQLILAVNIATEALMQVHNKKLHVFPGVPFGVPLNVDAMSEMAYHALDDMRRALGGDPPSYRFLR